MSQKANLIAHRGLTDYHSDNSMGAFARAWNSPEFSGFECDIRSDVSGNLFCHHDSTYYLDHINEIIPFNQRAFIPTDTMPPVDVVLRTFNSPQKSILLDLKDFTKRDCETLINLVVKTRVEYNTETHIVALTDNYTIYSMLNGYIDRLYLATLRTPRSDMPYFATLCCENNKHFKRSLIDYKFGRHSVWGADTKEDIDFFSEYCRFIITDWIP